MAREHDALQKDERRRLVETVCRDYSHWAPQLSQAPCPGRVLRGGYNNHVQIIEEKSQRWVVRIGCSDSQSADAHAREIAIHRDAATEKIAPEIVFADSSKRLSVMPYLDERPDIDIPGAMLAALLRSVHSLPTKGEHRHSSTVFLHHKNKVIKGTHLAHVMETGKSQIEKAMNRLQNDRSFRSTLCHNDLLRSNRLLAQDGCLYALDWEYAQIGDPFFDLAVCASELNEAEGEELLTLYLERTPTPEEYRRYRDQGLIYRCIEACWFQIYHPQLPQTHISTQHLSNILLSEVSL